MALSPYDQQVYDAGFKFIPQTQYLQNPFLIPQDTTETVSEGGVATLPINMGGGSGGGYSGGINDLMQNFTLDTRNQYFDRQPTPLVDDLYQSKLDRTFMGFPSFREQELTGADLGEYIGSDTDVPLELTRAGKIQQGIGNVKEGIGKAISSIGGFGPLSFVLSKMDRFSSLPAADQEFIKMNMGYTGPTVFGKNTSGLSKDIYGINTRSLFGNYANYVDDFVDQYKDMDEEEFDKLSDFRKQKINFYRQQQKRLKDVREQKAKEEAAAAAAAAAERNRVAQVQSRLDSGTYVDRDDRGLSASDRAVGGGAKGRAANIDNDRSTGTSQGYTQHYMDGGIVDMLEIYD